MTQKGETQESIDATLHYKERELAAKGGIVANLMSVNHQLNEKKELEQAKAALTAKWKEEKSAQISTNTNLLKRIASKTSSGTRRRSSIFKR